MYKTIPRAQYREREWLPAALTLAVSLLAWNTVRRSFAHVTTECGVIAIAALILVGGVTLILTIVNRLRWNLSSMFPRLAGVYKETAPEVSNGWQSWTVTVALIVAAPVLYTVVDTVIHVYYLPLWAGVVVVLAVVLLLLGVDLRFYWVGFFILSQAAIAIVYGMYGYSVGSGVQVLFGFGVSLVVLRLRLRTYHGLRFPLLL